MISFLWSFVQSVIHMVLKQQILRLIFDLDNKVDDFKFDFSVGHCDSRELLLLWFMWLSKFFEKGRSFRIT